MDAVNAGLDDKLFAHLQEAIKVTAYYNLLGIKLHLLSSGYAEIKVLAGQEHTNPMGLIHGGLITSIADAAMGNAVRSLAIKGVTVDMSTAFTAAARLGDTIIARGKVIKTGRNLIFAEALVYAGDTLIGDAKATFYKISELNY